MIANKQKNTNGFTIVELLVVVSIMAILSVIFTNILVDTLRGRNKVKAINQVKQNGQVALGQLSNEIRNADGIICVDKFVGGGGGVEKDTLVISNGGVYTQFRLISSTPTSNGYIQKGIINSDTVYNNNNTPENLCTQTLISATDLMQKLTDSDPKNGVSVIVAPGEDVFKQSGDNIVIKFNATAGVSAGFAYDMTVVDNGIPFSTSVQVRGFKDR